MNVLLLVPVFLFSLCVHEYAHAWVAVRRGDSTPLLAGRLSLHPMAHADWIGTLLLPIVCIYNGWPFFGWAKPVPVDARNMPGGRRDMALVAAAGPLANILLALVSTAILYGLLRVPMEARVVETVQLFMAISIQVNLMLAIFNLLPIPPLDGFNILQGFLSTRRAVQFASYARYANLLLLVLLFTGGLQVLVWPVRVGYQFLLGMAGIS